MLVRSGRYQIRGRLHTSGTVEELLDENSIEVLAALKITIHFVFYRREPYHPSEYMDINKISIIYEYMFHTVPDVASCQVLGKSHTPAGT